MHLLEKIAAGELLVDSELTEKFNSEVSFDEKEMISFFLKEKLKKHLDIRNKAVYNI